MKIGKRKIGENHPAFIIAEAGVNHNGEISQAKKLVDAAADSGADAVKFQTYTSEEVTTKSATSADYAQKNLKNNLTQLQLLKKYELTFEDFHTIKDYCDQQNIIFLSTPHSFDAIDFLEPLVPAYKFGSGDLTNHPTLKYAAKKNKPIILGTGMSTLEEVKKAIKEIYSTGNKQVIALHCTTSYPCPLEEANLQAITTMKKKLNCLIGFSDHTTSLIPPIIATALGVKVIEKHFTLDRKFTGPDHKASIEPDELTKMIQYIKETEKILGSYEKKPTTSEEKIKLIVRKSIIANTDIKPGLKFTENMLTIKRPCNGLPPSEIKKIIGKKAKTYIKKDTPIQKNMVE